MLKKITFRTLSAVMNSLVVMLVLFGLGVVCSAQDVAPTTSNSPASPTQSVEKVESPQANLVNPTPSPITIEAGQQYMTSPEFILTLMVIILAVAALMMQFLLLKQPSKLKADDTLRVFGVTLIIIGTLFFITAGFNSQQIAPAMGLFGTIAGYLLGKIERKENEKNA